MSTRLRQEMDRIAQAREGGRREGYVQALKEVQAAIRGLLEELEGAVRALESEGTE